MISHPKLKARDGDPDACPLTNPNNIDSKNGEPERWMPFCSREDDEEMLMMKESLKRVGDDERVTYMNKATINKRGAGPLNP